MARSRLHASDAARQQAYRQRQQTAPVPLVKRPRRQTRPVRVASVEAELRSLAAEYQHWLDALPDNQADSEFAAQLQTMVEQLEDLADGVGQLDVPRGFGR